ncbi:hypothetical protein SAMN06265368_1624 [Cohaesibacter gelatinilyticus]|uniref:Uncharacterized protein n=1 Tax=Cohaesibacter gelatinilyticus TaxID=372072 RepID=A0A285NFT7_9HYPH|nr:hypothetical protein SAMN06265368_1624 [Cohaesibacter gelatinilyticus]
MVSKSPPSRGQFVRRFMQNPAHEVNYPISVSVRNLQYQQPGASNTPLPQTSKAQISAAFRGFAKNGEKFTPHINASYHTINRPRIREQKSHYLTSPASKNIPSD